MWVCPSCGRQFRNSNQTHYCGIKPADIDEYIAAQSEEVQEFLSNVRNTIKAAAPEAEERIAWQMPTFWQGDYLIHFSAHTNHLSIHPGALDRLPEEILIRLADYKTTKGSIHFPYSKPIDYELIADITKHRVLMLSNDH